MMPGATDCVSYDEAVNKGCSIMRARRANREHLIAAPDKKHRFTAGVAEQPSSVWNGRNLYSLREIRSAEFCIFLGHLSSPGISRGSVASR